MPTDDERRRVAAALRHYASSDIDGGLLPSLKDAAEVAGGTWRTLFIRLADLIEPAPKCSEAAPKCDRDALLALADEIMRKSDDGTVNPDPMRPLATSLDLFGYARRIREACGEVG